ncbi:MAG: Gmad2 immunoglobulin-like domain-containing protein [Thermoanaerobacteraceae bacterium]|nr:Gmad2 immunoglobulin-like domain-containing protein [Thermoanaerobacteraceae bacterium]
MLGLKDNYLARGEGNIRLLSCHVNGSNIRVSGIARVFEANLNYELQDAAGNVFDRGYTMAASGAPDWGFWQVEIHNLPPSAARLQLYHASPKDGSRQDIVTIEIE